MLDVTQRARYIGTNGKPGQGSNRHGKSGEDMVIHLNRPTAAAALQEIKDKVFELAGADNAVILVTHYQRLLNYIVPDVVHVLMDGRIVKSGGRELALKLEEKGYDWLRDEAGVAQAQEPARS